jgi:parallel beta-helix repeat protein
MQMNHFRGIKGYAIWIFLLFSMGFITACSLNSSVVQNEDLDPPQVEQPISHGSTPALAAVEIQSSPVPSSGQMYYVDPAGSDGNDGSQKTPWESIQHAVDNVIPGDTILLQSGTYVGARIERSGTPDAWIILQAAPGASVLINAPGPNNRHESNLEFETWEGDETVSYWIVSDIEIADAPNWGVDVRGGVLNHSHHFIIKNNLVHDNGQDSGKTGIFFAFVDDVVVEGNESYSNGEHGIYLSNSGDRFVIRGNLLHDNENCGLHMNGDLESGEDGIISDGLVENNIIYENGFGGCSGINMDGVTDTIVRNNLLYQNHAGGISIFQENGAVCSQNIQVLNNTIVQPEDGRWAINISDDDCINNKIFNNILLTFHRRLGSILIPSSGISGFESDYNIILDRFSADDDESIITLSQWQAFGYDSNSIIAKSNDLIVSYEDYHLLSESPAIDAGVDLPGVGKDLAGLPRPQGDAFDIGAFEFAASLGQVPATEEALSLQETQAEGTITYVFNDSVYRITVQEGAIPEDISQALDQLSPRGGDGALNISPDGEWMVLDTERFDTDCEGWACLAIISADLSFGEAVRANGQIIHPEGISAIASGGEIIVYPYGGGPNEIDLWATTKSGDAWGEPHLITADSPHNFNNMPAISFDGSKVVFNCGPNPYGGEGTGICEVGIDSRGFRVVLTPADSPAGFPATGALHQPDYSPDGSIIFEADWNSEQIWRLPTGALEPVLITATFGNDNSPCVLPDGRIVSLWLDRPSGTGVHEIKVMAADGSVFFILLPDIDVLDVGMGCAP